MDMIRPIDRPSVSDQVCEQMKEMMLTGVWKAGDKIPAELELANSFGVSRVTIREALLRLSSLGFIESKFGGGNYVRRITPGLNISPIVPVAYLDTNSILEITEYRLVVEVRTAGLAARRATEKDIEVLEGTWQNMNRYRTHDPRRYAEEDLNFHLELAKITGNSLIIETLNVIRSLLSQAVYIAIQQRGIRGLRNHRLLIDAIARHEEKRTMSIMQRHLTNAYKSIEKKLMRESLANQSKTPSHAEDPRPTQQG